MFNIYCVSRESREIPVDISVVGRLDLEHPSGHIILVLSRNSDLIYYIFSLSAKHLYKNSAEIQF